MTCIVGMIKNGTVYIGGDSAGSSNYSMTIVSNPKVFILQKEFVIGYTSSFRMGQIIENDLVIPSRAKDMNVYRFMTTVFIDALRDCLKKCGWAEKEKDREIGGTFLVGYCGRLFTVQDDFSVLESLDLYDAVGSGCYIALGSLHSTTGTPIKRIEKALEAAAKFTPSVEGPFHIRALKWKE